MTGPRQQDSPGAARQKITLGEMRHPEGGYGGTRALLVYCADFRCGHLLRLPGAKVDKWPDDVRLSDLEPKFVCTKCGQRGADVRPDFDAPQLVAITDPPPKET